MRSAASVGQFCRDWLDGCCDGQRNRRKSVVSTAKPGIATTRAREKTARDAGRFGNAGGSVS
ncbi:hypothetical protein [Lysobacter gummosus]|uniref:hypothetical protein n=1 Tax=Lysobacter gummosus TaxID=262324 RepID=UPI00363A7FF1